MAEQTSSEQSIFLTALEKQAPAERAAYLDQVCAGNARLREEVERLLTAHERLPAGGAVTEVSPAPVGHAMLFAAGSTIGRYKLLETIGEGGYGTVFMAEQTTPVQRKVALKIIKAGMDTKHVIARFEAERQALALMDHPNIAKVFDAGVTEMGRPYFVMELVKGVPITKYCDEHKLTPKQRLELFVQVCHAVQHAHQKGIIHRDIKPTNVLIAQYDGHPVPKVIDFGVAKAMGQQLTDKTMFTGFGDVVGTLEYMSPEQAEVNQLDVDTRSDIYSLGVLVYELLTGTTPLQHKRAREAALLEVLRLIREEEPPKPSTRLTTAEELPSIAAQRGVEPKHLAKLVHGELDWIVMKALEKERSRRYETANGLAMDVQRYLHDEPVQACPPSARYRLRKFLRKYRVPIAVSASFIVLLAVASIVSTWQAVRATRAEAHSRDNEAKARANETKARTEAAKATAVSNLLQEMFQSASPNPKVGPDYTVRQLLDDFSARLGDQLKDQPEVEMTIRATIGNTYGQLALTKQAEPHLRKALELRRQVYGPEHVSVGDALMAYAWNLRKAKDAAGAERYAREALSIYQKQNASPKVILTAYSAMMNFLTAQSKYPEAEAVGQEAISFGRKRGQEVQLGGILQALSTINRMAGKFDEAERLSREALALQRSIPGGSLIYPLLEHATNLSVQGKRAEAEPLLREALELLRQSHYDEAHPTVIDVKTRLADLLRNKGDTEGMKAVLEPLLPHLDAAIARAPDNLFGRMRRANALRDLGKLDEAIKEYSEIISRKPDHEGAWKERAGCYLRKGDYLKAAEDLSAKIDCSEEVCSAISSS